MSISAIPGIVHAGADQEGSSLLCPEVGGWQQPCPHCCTIVSQGLSLWHANVAIDRVALRGNAAFSFCRECTRTARCEDIQGKPHSWHSPPGSCRRLFLAELFWAAFTRPLLVPPTNRLFHEWAATNSSFLLIILDWF